MKQITSATLDEVSLVTDPAIDSARVSEVAASENEAPKKDSVISLVSSRPIPKKLKQEFHAEFGNLKGSEYKKAKRKFYGEKGVVHDARAIANEFGTANMSAKPFMRTSLESQAQSVSALLGQILKARIESYKPKQKI